MTFVDLIDFECSSENARPVHYKLNQYPFDYVIWECGECDICIAHKIGRKLISYA